MQLLKRTTLHCQEGSSDKVYEVDLCQTEGGYLVNFRYGRRGTTLKEGVKTTTPVPLAQAEKVFDKLVSEKTKKGYHDVSEPISAPETTPKVTFTSREQAILERLAGRGNPKWPLSRVIWRAGELHMSEATPQLLELLGKHDALTDYCIAWALGYCGGEGALEALIQLYQNSATPEFVARIAFEAILKLSDPQTQADLQSEMIEFLPPELRSLAQNGSIEALTAELNRYLESADYQHFAVLDRFYQIDNAYTRPVLLNLLKTVSFRPNFFQRIRHIFKMAEYRRDAEVFAILVRRFESEPRYYVNNRWGVNVPGVGYLSNQEYRYNPETRRGEYITTHALTNEIRSPNSHLAYSNRTCEYFKRRMWRSLKQLGEANNPDYIAIAVSLLLQYCDRDAQPVKSTVLYRWNYQTGAATQQKIEWGAFAGYLTFNHILHENSPDFYLAPGTTAWRTRLSASERVSEVREEAFPQLWDNHPEALLQLLQASECLPVHQFAAKALREQGQFCQTLSLATLVQLVGKPYEVTAKLAYDLIVQNGYHQSADFELILAVLRCVSPVARAGAYSWIEANRERYLESSQFIADLVLSEYTDTRAFARRLLSSSVISDATAKVLIGRIIAGLISLTPAQAELAKEVGETLVVCFAPQLRQIGLGVVIDLLRHPLPEVQETGARILLNHATPAVELPPNLIESLIESPYEAVRVIGVRILGQLPDDRLMRDRTLLVAMAVSSVPDLRAGIQSTIRRLGDRYPDFSTQIATDLIEVLLSPEKHEGVHNDVVQLLKSLPQWQDNIEREINLKLLQAKSSAAQELGGVVLLRHASDWVLEFEVAELVKLASHQILAVREAARQMFVSNRDKIRNSTEAKLAAVRILESKWQDSREFAHQFFNTQFIPEDWTPDVMILVCDSIRDDVRQFGRDLVTRYFEQDYGTEYLLKFSEHPSADMQLFASHYLENYAANNLERLRQLMPYFITVLCQVNRGRVAKDRIFKFLKKESQKTEAAAQIVAEILTRQSLTMAIGDKATAIQILLKIHQQYPQIPVPLQIQPVPTQV
ncbi:WGR domain-containing protein [Desertifilum sp. FACHB-1129]|uniref:WGR domain-containing protein n=1 Tax=Desertifilum tharense IPPAS B-1220 TaxID=1781255 RepID=A0A1E5QI60_9CYAN|nr:MULTISPECIES: WGR domain-containing protein [Desertifilum]MDA0210025.1 WGR domain-containing protein [Cyanobacteria bacterium FC1]MBD2312670.1 WGR domain-containing protein [Desertifilum sp. FACHB-1129]MBD2320430.1 WGR domain-containing protein [Desertifilum sp. FACHB-866]MBD2330558.1 WGR domain-containing protein [Desertifilum sp. FACHB-868]OEJ74369.1 hypothetical protein BH720_14145 [Desertifilum tharense IPPAS B-1220]